MQLSSLVGHTRELLALIRASRKPADSLIDSYFRTRKYLGSHDRRFIAETTYGTLRHLRSCETRVQAILNGIQNISDDDRLLFVIAAYLIDHEKRTDITAEALSASLRTSELKSRLGEMLAELMKPGPATSDDSVESLGVRYSFPHWMMESFLRQFGPTETRALCESLNQPAPLALRVNTLKTTVEECRHRLQKEGIETERTAFSPVGLVVPKRLNIFALQSFRDGLYEVQDEGSQLVALLIDPKPTWKVLDACAGAGGKSLALAALMKNRGEIFGVDVQEYRLEELRKRCRRAGVSNVRVSLAGDLASKHPWTPGYFDCVFLDAPCSGLGTIRRNPGLKWTVTGSDVAELQNKQLQILEENVRFLRPGGALVYTTCSLLKEENENVVERFLSRHPEFVPSDVRERAGKCGIENAVQDHYVRLLPPTHGTDGFFCAFLTRRIDPS